MHIKINNGINECDVYLIGTAHVSGESINEVERAISNINPDLIAVELDKDRFFAITNNNVGKMKNNGKNNIDILKLIKEGNIGIFLIHTILANFQKDIGEKFGIKPGSEMKKAVDLAIEYGKPISLIDRPINITLKRALKSMSFKEKLSFLFGIFDDKNNPELDEKSLNEMINNAEDLIKILKEMSPSIYKVLVDERDKFMAKNIFEISKEKEKILAVVGAGHLKGIANYLKKLEKNEIDINLKELMEIKKGKNYFKIIFSAIVLCIILYGFYSISSNPEALKKLTIDWIFINGSLSALGAILARGKIPSIISAFLAAPITSLIPVIGAGYVAGLVELKYRGITSEDIDELFNSDDLKRLMNNNIIRVLMVATLSSIGSAIGTFYFVPGFLHLFW
ncbi:TraB/GumN family protein [Methanothermococcus sp.]|uniref:TraB/GumN family protein n=1 Tax=Methanothermococcus sp. TaxID=2614238 RepID=UPI0025FCFD66|nr:TraB/GumN family protein [Methanothermococcus sp.]